MLLQVEMLGSNEQRAAGDGRRVMSDGQRAARC